MTTKERCPKCGGALFTDEDGLACLCGYRGYKQQSIAKQEKPKQATPRSDARKLDSDSIGWWCPLGTHPGQLEKDVVRASELSQTVMNQCQSNEFSIGQLYIALRVIRLRLESDFGISLSRLQESYLDSYLKRKLQNNGI
jgi:DNA-directed RNA polymerase subunit M/transcription elongation factor TFIIS